LIRTLALFACLAFALAATAAGGSSRASDTHYVRVAYVAADIDSLDPALSYTVASALLLDPTCALLLRPGGTAGLRPEVATGYPRVSNGGRTFTFSLRSGFRFSDGKPVLASAFARSIARTLAPGVKSPWAAYTRDIVGAEDVTAGKATTPSGVLARGLELVVRLKRPVPDFPAWTTFLCAVPPRLPADPEGVAVFPGSGPYYVSDYRSGERVVLRRNPYYGGRRERHVEGFLVDLRASSEEEVLDRIERGEADWGWALPILYFDPARRLAEKYGINKLRFFVHPGAIWRGYAFNTSRPLFRNNPQLRRAVSFAIDRAAFRRAGGGGSRAR
jgi:oligopeptide transport system substrate-binding protein